MAVFAVTGSLASGKTTILRLLKNKGADIFNADKEVHKYYRDKKSGIYKEIVSLFPQTVERGRISRRKLRGIVFSDKRKLRKLERIVHPFIIDDLKRQLKYARRKGKIYVAEIPLLFEKKLSRFFQGVILVYVKRDILIKRIRKESGFSGKQAVKRLLLYSSLKEKKRKADFIINNSFSVRRLKDEVDCLWEKLKSLSRD